MGFAKLRATNRTITFLVAAIFLLLSGLFGPPSGFLTFASEPTYSIAPLIASGTKYFVALNGSNAGPGSFDRPWATINHAAAQVKAGDMVLVRGGHYVLSAQVRPLNSGRSDAWITFVGYPGEEAILDAQSVRRSSFTHGVLNDGIFQIQGKP